MERTLATRQAACCGSGLRVPRSWLTSMAQMPHVALIESIANRVFLGKFVPGQSTAIISVSGCSNARFVVPLHQRDHTPEPSGQTYHDSHTPPPPPPPLGSRKPAHARPGPDLPSYVRVGHWHGPYYAPAAAIHSKRRRGRDRINHSFSVRLAACHRPPTRQTHRPSQLRAARSPLGPRTAPLPRRGRQVPPGPSSPSARRCAPRLACGGHRAARRDTMAS